MPLDELVEGLIEADSGRALAALASALQSGRDARSLAEDLIDHLRDSFLAMVAPELVQLPDRRRDIVQDQAPPARPAGDGPGYRGPGRGRGRAAPRSGPAGAAGRRDGPTHEVRCRLVARRAPGEDREAGTAWWRPARPMRPPARPPPPGRPAAVGPGWAAPSPPHPIHPSRRLPRRPCRRLPRGRRKHPGRTRPHSPSRSPLRRSAPTAVAPGDEPTRATSSPWPGPIRSCPSCRARLAPCWPPGVGWPRRRAPSSSSRTSRIGPAASSIAATLESVLAAHFGRDVPVAFVVEPEATPAIAERRRAPASPLDREEHGRTAITVSAIPTRRSTWPSSSTPAPNTTRADRATRRRRSPAPS